jgi:two-component system, NtrC family, sensor histidine kinase PilS
MAASADTQARPVAVNETIPAQYPESYWRSLHYFNIYRTAVALVLLLGAAFSQATSHLGSYDRTLFLQVAVMYLSFGVASAFLIRTRWRFNVQLAAQVIADIGFIVVLIYASNGITSGLGLLLLTTLAGAGLISRGRLTLFYAAVASIAVLLEHSYEVMVFQEGAAQFLHAGFLSVGYFATALVAHTLARWTRQSERIAAQREIDLANMSEVNRLVIQDMPDGVVVVDGKGGIRQVNRQAETLLGALPARDEVMLVDYAPGVAAVLARWRSGAGGVASGYAASMDERHGLRFVPVGDAPGAGTVIFLEDLSRAREEAQQMKLAAIGRLTSNIAHEIRNPLGSISHAAQLLHEEPGGSATTQRLLGIIHDNTQRLNRMVNDVLGLNRGQAAHLETVAVDDFVRQFVAEFAETERADANIFSVQIDAALTAIFDRTHLNQILWNLCRNALRHCRGHAGSIHIRARAVRASRVVKLDIADDGPGVAPAVRSGLFEPFVTTAAGGTGLGLYIARELCVANGATLEYVESSAGAQFTLTCRAGG